MADPQEDEDRAGEPILLLLVAFFAPGEESGEEHDPACCEIEVPAEIAAKAGAELRAGVAVIITGALTGGGGVRAAQVFAGVSDGTR